MTPNQETQNTVTIPPHLTIPITDLSQSISNIKPFASPFQLRLIQRLEYFINSVKRPSGARLKVNKFAEKLAALNLSSGKNEIKFYFQIVEQILGPSLLLKMMLDHYIRVITANRKATAKESKNLPKPQDLRSSIRACNNKGRKDLAWFLIILFITGRRGRDLKRMALKKLIKLNDLTWQATIPRDKKNPHKVTFILDFRLCVEEWCGSGPTEASNNFENWIKERKGNLFESVCLKTLASNTLNFTPHQLRGVRAILWTLDGFSDGQVMEKVGWRDPKSLLRYRQLPGGLIQGRSREEIWMTIGSNDSGLFF